MALTRKINKFTILLCGIILLVNSASAQVSSPFNHLSIKDTSTNYSFIVSGHFHGASTNNSTFPASSILANIDSINSLNSLFLISLGDLFLDVNDNYINHYKYSLFDKLKMPFFNSVGNHDLAGNHYENNYGKTFFSFINESELFIVLNTELNDGSIKDEQLKFLSNMLDSAVSKNIKNTFIFSHRPIWSERIDKYSKLFSDNTRTAIGKNNFNEDLKPLLQKVSKNKNVYWISGSMGGSAPASFFYDKNEDMNVTFMCTAIRDLPRDALLQIKVNNGIVSMKGISLTGQTLNSIENYNLDYWKKTIPEEQKFNFRLLPYLTKQMLLHHYFWIGFFSATLILLLIRIIRRKKRNKLGRI